MAEMKNKAYVKTIPRLNEVLKHLYTAANEYFHPENFRIALNACIQSARNVTFVLQKNKSEIENFDSWYGEWRTALAKDPIMKWCVEARNRIVKEGDLETHSIAKVKLLISYDTPPSYTYNVNPFFDSDSIAEFIRKEKLPQEIEKFGFIIVERQWICADMQNIELLTVLSHAFTILCSLLIDIDEKKGPYTIYNNDDVKGDDEYIRITQKIKDHKRPDFIKNLHKIRTSTMKLSNGMISEYVSEPIDTSKFDENDFARYDFTSLGRLEKISSKSELSKKVKFLLQTGKIIFKTDGYHHPVIFLFNKNGSIAINRTIFNDNEDKYLFWEKIADEVRKCNYFSVIVISDTWVSKFNEKAPMLRAEDDPKRTEALQAAGIDKWGNSTVITAPYTRTSEEIIFNENIIDENSKIGFLEPIRRVWESK